MNVTILICAVGMALRGLDGPQLCDLFSWKKMQFRTDMEDGANNPKSTLAFIRQKYLGKLVTGARSPVGNWLGFTLEEIERGKASLSLSLRREMCNPYGNIHGGMMAVVIDEAIGWAVMSLDLASNYTSLNLNVDFLYAVGEGERMHATATVVRHGKKIIHVNAIVFDAEGRLLAKATSNLVVTGMQRVTDDFSESL